MNKNNLNRIKGILSAKQGTQIPKFQQGYTIYHKSTNQPLYSPDGNSWYTDQMYSNLFNGNINDYTTPNLQQQFQTKNSNITIPGQNNTTPSNILNSNIASNALTNIQSTQNSNKPYNLIQNPVTGISGVTNFANYHGLATPEGITQETEIKLPTKSAADVLSTQSQDLVMPKRQVELIDTNAQLEEGEDRFTPEEKEKIQKMYGYGAAASAALQTVGNAFGNAQMATDSDTTKTVDQVYDGAAEAVSQMGPYGKLIGTGMKMAGAVGDIAQSMGGGTDQQTKLDQWMDSSFLSWNVGMINGFFGKNADSFGLDQDIAAKLGSSYGGSVSDMSELSEKAGKKYGLFSSKARKKVNESIAKANSQENLMGDIADQASAQRLAVQSMGEQAGLAYSLMTDGGYNQKYTYAAKEGGILEWNPQIELKWEPQIELNWELPKFKEGGNIDITEELEWIPKLQEGSKTRTIEELIEYAKKENPRFIQRMSEPLRFIRINFKDEDGNTSWAHATHEMNYKGKDVFPMIQEINGKLHKFDSEKEAYENAKKTNNILTFDSEEEAKLFAESGQNENGKYYGYKLGWQDFFNISPEGLKEEYSINQYKQGGSIKESDIPEIEETNQKNVIPEGALHKNKHHMEHAEGLTKKGIPVIDEEGEQQAEIEHSEIIFTLEVTKKLEEYYQIFYSEESTNKEKEQAALDAGKLLVYQILENTEDRTGLIDSCKKGGTLNLKKSTDDLIEEVLEWIPNITIIEEVIEEPEKDSKKESKKESKKSEKEQMKEAIKELLIELLTK